MKIISLHESSSFVPFKMMSIDVAGNRILFGGLASNLPLAQFNCANDPVAKVIYLKLIDYLGDKGAKGDFNLPSLDSEMLRLWELAPSVGRAINEFVLRGASQTLGVIASSSADTIDYDIVNDYLDDWGKPNHYGRIIMDFHKIQQAAASK